MMKKIFAYGKENNKTTAFSIVILFLSTLFLVAPFVFISMILRRMLNQEGLNERFLVYMVLAVGISMILQGACYCWGLDLSHRAAYGTLMNLRISLQKKLERLPLGEIRERGTGAYKKIFVDDIDSLETLLAHAVPEGLSNIMGVLVVYGAIFVTDWRMGLLVLAMLPIGMIPMMVMYGIGTQRMKDYYKAGKIMNNTIIEYVNGMEVVKVFNRSGDSYKRLQNAVFSYRDFTLSWYEACWPWMAAYGALLPCTATIGLPVGAILVHHNIIALHSYTIGLCLAFGLGAPLLRTLSFLSVMPQLKYKIEEIEKIMNAKPLEEKDAKFHGKDYGITFDHVVFGYEEEDVIKDVSLRLEPNTKTALVGPSGSGKSTLAKLLVHYYDLKQGNIFIGGQKIQDMSLGELNDLISYVSQDNFLFNISIKENIRLGNPKATDEQVQAAAEAAYCMEFVDRFPQGLDTLAGDAGSKLSGGERQRVSLARAILKNAPIVVLDEATAFADAKSQTKIEQALAEFIKGKTVLIIAHRLSTIVNAEQICVLKDGKIEDCAAHGVLLERCGLYQSLWEANLRSTNWKIGKENQ